MANKVNRKSNPNQPQVYEIRIRGRLGMEWAEGFDGLSITWDDNGDTLLTGPVIDQAALYGLLRRVRDLGVQLISVTSLESDRPGSI